MKTKKLILLVGPMGSGKSTYCKEHLSDYHRINQDEMGKHAHMVNFLVALDTEDKIVVDRCNFPRKQRRNFIDPAREKGWHVKIIVMNVPFKTCHDRIMKRGEHPTLSNKNEQHILNALTMYFTKYDYVHDGEADEIVRLNDYDPFLLDITKRAKKSRIILIGDVHGCFDEVQKLLKKVDYKPKEDYLVFAGDLNDRGPKISQVINFVRQNQGGKVYSVMGNHCNKYLRYLRGNNVNTYGLRHTIAQVKGDQDLRIWFESTPYSIKFRENKYIVHAGIDPTRPVERQRRDALMYARTFNPVTFSVTDKLAEPWFSFEPVQKGITVYFGHAIYDKFHKSNWGKSLDGGAYKGKVLRAYVSYPNGYDEVVEVKSDFTFKGEEEENEYHESLEPYELRVQAGYLRKSENDGMVLYKYTDQCTFDKKWDEYTRPARGIIFKKWTGECVARPFEKFFNLGEMPETSMDNLPMDPTAYEVFDKLDGSLGILYWCKGEARIATAGSLLSDQALEATKILKKYDLSDLDRDLTLLFEIIYPENKIVCNYGDTRDLFLLAAIDKNTGVEMSFKKVKAIAKVLKCPVVEQFNHSIPDMIRYKHTLPYDKEGFVIRTVDGLRVKIKGDEYLRIHRAISGATPLNIWRNLVNGKLPDDYFVGVPEEVIKEVEALAKTLTAQYALALKNVKEDIDSIPFSTVPWTDAKRKELGLYLKSSGKDLNHPSIMFAYLNGNSEKIDKYILKSIRPTGNDLNEAT